MWNKHTPSTQNPKVSKPNILLYLGRLDFDKIWISLSKRPITSNRIMRSGLLVTGNHLAFRSLTSKLNLDSRVKFLGLYTEEKKVDLYRQATIFVLPSTAEAQSIVSLKQPPAASLILANSQALPELISPDHPNGILFQPQRPAGFSYENRSPAIQSLQLTKMGKNSRRLAETHNTKRQSPTTNKHTYPSFPTKMKFNIRLLYLYLFSFVGLLITIIGSVQIIDLGLKTYVFKVSEYSFYPEPVAVGGKPTIPAEEMAKRNKIEQSNQNKRQLSTSLSMIPGWRAPLPLSLENYQERSQANRQLPLINSLR